MLSGPVYALSSAAAWSAAVILFKKSEALDPIGLNFLKNLLGLTLFALTLLVWPEPIPELSLWDWAALVLSGAVGAGLADTLFFQSLSRLGAARSAIVDCTYSPFIVVFAFFILGETLSLYDALGAATIVGAIVITVGGSRQDPLPRPVLISGALYGIAAMGLMGLAIVAIKPILDRAPVLPCTTARMFGAVLGLSLWCAVDRRARAKVRAALTPQPAWRHALPGAIVGTYVALLLWVASFKYNPANVASILNQTSTVFTVVLAVIFLGERLDRRRVMAVTLALGGSALVLL